MCMLSQLLTFWYFSSRGYSKLLHSITSPVVLTRCHNLPHTSLCSMSLLHLAARRPHDSHVADSSSSSP